MRGFSAVLRRELAARWLVLAAAALMSLLPIAAPLLPGGSAAVRGDTALVLAGLVSGVLALLLGASVVAADLSGRRLSFYFARPISGAAIWAGKIGAAALLASGAGLIVLLPSLLLGRLQAGSLRLDVFLTAVKALLLLLLFAHAASVALRSRSPWILLDLSSLCAVLGLGLLGWIALQREWATDSIAGWPETVFSLLQIAFLAAAGAVQVIRGRADLGRSHRILSLTLWPLLLAGALTFFGYTRWLVGADLEDVTRVSSAFAAPAGDWFFLKGPAAHRRGYAPSFLVDAATGRSIRLPSQVSFSFSEDGRKAAWGVVAWNGIPYGVMSLDLSRRGNSPAQEPILSIGYGRLALSPGGRHLVTMDAANLTVDDLRDRRIVASVRLEGGSARTVLRFPDAGHLRTFRFKERFDLGSRSFRSRLQIGDLDLATGAQDQRESLEGTETLEISFLPDRSGQRFVARESEGAPLRLYDGRTGGALADLAIPHAVAAAHFLADGRLLLSLRKAAGMELRLIDPDDPGQPRSFRFPGANALRIGGQPRRNLLTLAQGTAGAKGTWRSTLLDLDSGVRRDLGRELLPIPATGLVPGPGSVGSRLFFRSGALVRFDPLTGSERPIAGHPEGE